MPSPKPRSGPFAVLTLLAIVLSFTLCGCPCISAPVNASPGFRWWLFSNFGASRVCPEMLKRGVAIRFQERSPAIGRFFPMQCTTSVDNGRQVLVVNLAGTGYGYVVPAKRVGFSLTASVEYRPDFRVAGDDIYIWARLNRLVQGPNFQLGAVENQLVDLAANLPGVGGIPNYLGNQVVSAAMTQGFTVIHNEDRGNDFTTGILFPPDRPHHPFQAQNTDRVTFANEAVEVHGNQRDYLGPFEIANPGQSLFVTLQLQGNAVDVMVVDKLTGDAWRDSYQTGKPLGPAPGAVLAGSVLQPGVPDNRRYNLAPGLYYVVIDNTPAAGLVSPPVALFGMGDSVATVNYIAQVGNN